MTISRIVILLSTIALAQPALAECPSFWDFSKFDRATNTADKDYSYGLGPVDGLAAVAQSLAEIATSTDKSKATLRYAVSTSGAQDLPPPTDTSTKITGCNHALSIEISSPLDKSDNITDITTLDGLANAVTLKISYARYIDSIWRNPPGSEEVLDTSRYFFGGSATIGREDFDYVDFDAFDDASENEEPWSVTAFFGGDVGSWTITAEVKLEESFEDQDSITRCRSIMDSMDLDCMTGSPGPPTEKDSRQASVEFRKLLPGGIGLAPTITRDFEKDVTAVNVPVFLWQDPSSGQLTGGIRAGWRDDTDNFEVGLFITQPF